MYLCSWLALLDDIFQSHKDNNNWKTPGLDGIHRFWLKNFTSIHNKLATEMNKCIQKTEISKWMTKGKTTLIQKGSLKGITPNNYRLIMCLLMIWKILTAQIREEIYNSLISSGLFLERMPQRNLRHRRTTIYRSTHHQ